MPPVETPSDRAQELIRILEKGPVTHGDLVRRARDAGISPATVNRYLGELKAAGVALNLGAEGYGLAQDYQGPSWGVMEVVRWDHLTVLHPDGSYWTRKVFHYRMRWGTLTAFPLRLYLTRGLRRSDFACWGSGNPRVGRVGKDRTLSSCTITEIVFGTPETASDSEFELGISYSGDRTFRMYRGQRLAEYIEQNDVTGVWERSEMAILERPAIGTRRIVSPRAVLQMTIVLPRDYPISRAQVLSWPHASLGLPTGRETARRRRGPGLVNRTNVLSWTIPRPLLDRTYAIRWLPPDRRNHLRWIAGLRSPPTTGPAE